MRERKNRASGIIVLSPRAAVGSRGQVFEHMQAWVLVYAAKSFS